MKFGQALGEGGESHTKINRQIPYFISVPYGDVHLKVSLLRNGRIPHMLILLKYELHFNRKANKQKNHLFKFLSYLGTAP